MKVSVIMPNYNGESTIAQQMDALVRQTWQDDWEFIMADNGSTDRSVEIVKSYSDRIPNMRILNVYSGSGPREPVVSSYVKAFHAAKGEIFISCESDDEAADGWLEAMVEAMDDADFVASALDDHKLNSADLMRRDRTGQQSRERGLPNFVGPLKLPFCSGCAIGITRHLWETVGDPDPAVANTWDIDYSWRAQLAGFEIKFVPEALMHYRQRTSFSARYRQGKNYGVGSAMLNGKYGTKSQLRFLAYNLYHLAVGSLWLAWSYLPGTRSPTFRIWRVGNAIGQLQSFHYIRNGRKSILPLPDHLKPLTQ